MKLICKKSSLLLVIASLILIILTLACTAPKVQEAQLPQGLGSAMAPDMPLDAYLYIRQSQPTVIPGLFLGLLSDAAIQTIEAWAVPSDSDESVGVVITFVAQKDAEAIFKLIPNQTDLWKMQSGTDIFLVWGTGSGADGLKKVAETRQFVPLSKSNQDGLDLIGRLPGPPAVKPLAVGFIRMEDRLISFLEKKSPVGSNESSVSALKQAKIKMAVAALYTNRDLAVADFLSPASLKDAGIGGILVAKSSYPGFVISPALGQAASMLNLEKTEVSGKTAYYRAVDGPDGQKIHVYLNNSGQYIYAEGAADQVRSQELFGWIFGSN